MCSSSVRILHKSRLQEIGAYYLPLPCTSYTSSPSRASFPEDSALQLRDLLVNLTARSMSAGLNRVTLRKLFVSVRCINGCFHNSTRLRLVDHVSCTEAGIERACSVAGLGHVDCSDLIEHGGIYRISIRLPVNSRSRGSNCGYAGTGKVSATSLRRNLIAHVRQVRHQTVSGQRNTDGSWSHHHMCHAAFLDKRTPCRPQMPGSMDMAAYWRVSILSPRWNLAS